MLALSDRVIVLSRGRVVHEGPSNTVRDHPEQLTALYLAGERV